ncbi:PDZ domain-containing protein [Candidatus Peregrinibacteria bacterium]|jgi:regulator of sigma E protease|nr:PDZ domain-containing protein [Candidatus Peregrinibacteria bacterium]MBT4632305.1 PDZ domain-containing protein [Candidatus Peregrinibacteria bacterium]MBT5516889.1 PDZ domain-containing protein [Candidatus Peregrinibacteria bacterium]MBT5824284.1 PDZ domain-containing protein [Candidatus Peregrinibacteria bacterium]
MHILLTGIVFILIFSALILVHELGHFTAAKRAGVKVEEFGMGLPPRMFGIKKGETLYSINWIPFGGFVRMLGEDPSVKGAKTNKRSFVNQPLLTQAWIVCAGVVMNFLMAFLLLSFGFFVGIEPLLATPDDVLNAVREEIIHVEVNGGDFEMLNEESEPFYLPRMIYYVFGEQNFAHLLEPNDVIMSVNDETVLSKEDFSELTMGQETVNLTVYRHGFGEMSFFDYVLPPVISEGQYLGPVITYIEEGSPAGQSGLLYGDQVVAIGGSAVQSAADVPELTSTKSLENVIEYTVRRGEEEIQMSIPLREDGRIGIAISDLNSGYEDFYFYSEPVPHTLLGIDKVAYGFKAPVVAVQEMWRLGKLTAVMFFGVLKNFLTFGGVPDGVSGPVGIAQMTAVSLQAGYSALIRFVALLSLSLGVINILPLPALDGGRLVFIVFQMITGKKPNARFENLIHTSGFLLLLLFILYITVNDVLNLF